jgi:hydroxyacyl-ACP dehydratase HTD2-like protein with hotdog domain
VTVEQAIVDQELIDSMREWIGKERAADLGVLDGLTIRRYARAVGETNPLYYDSDFARSHGYDDIIAPPNFAVSVLDWSEGSPNEELRHDGTEADVTMPGVPSSGYRLMGGGEDMTFHRPIHPGQHLTLTTSLREVELRQSRSGPMAVAKLLRRYFADGDLALESLQTILVR